MKRTFHRNVLLSVIFLGRSKTSPLAVILILFWTHCQAVKPCIHFLNHFSLSSISEGVWRSIPVVIGWETLDGSPVCHRVALKPVKQKLVLQLHYEGTLVSYMLLMFCSHLFAPSLLAYINVKHSEISSIGLDSIHFLPVPIFLCEHNRNYSWHLNSSLSALGSLKLFNCNSFHF